MSDYKLLKLLKDVREWDPRYSDYAKLSRRQERIFRLRLSGQTSEQIAELLQIKLSSVHSDLATAKKVLKTCHLRRIGRWFDPSA